jgi:hypothetical protein
MGLLEKTGGKRQGYLLRSIRFIQTYGIRFLVVSKFAPGIASLACPTAGIVNMTVWRFLLLNGLSRVFFGPPVLPGWITQGSNIPRHCGKHFDTSEVLNQADYPRSGPSLLGTLNKH